MLEKANLDKCEVQPSPFDKLRFTHTKAPEVRIFNHLSLRLIGLEKRTSAAKAVISEFGNGTAEAVPFVGICDDPVEVLLPSSEPPR